MGIGIDIDWYWLVLVDIDWGEHDTEREVGEGGVSVLVCCTLFAMWSVPLAFAFRRDVSYHILENDMMSALSYVGLYWSGAPSVTNVPSLFNSHKPIVNNCMISLA